VSQGETEREKERERERERERELQCILPDGISGAYIIVAIIKLSFMMIPQVVITVMQ
jgi:hypothetical protein